MDIPELHEGLQNLPYFFRKSLCLLSVTEGGGKRLSRGQAQRFHLLPTRVEMGLCRVRQKGLWSRGAWSSTIHKAVGFSRGQEALDVQSILIFQASW